MFRLERDKIIGIIGDICDIQHIGSTSILGMSGKGIIDILLIFKDSNLLKNAAIKLQKQYYLSKDNIERNGRIFMTSSPKESVAGDTHLHLVLNGSNDSKNMISFRDYLINHPDSKQAYINLKHRLFQQTRGNRAEYTQLKGAFIKEIIAKAK
jgi:GrpB-like predicted nucleotidyltransferase (UPF0157 family)